MKLERILSFKDKDIKHMTCREYHTLYGYKEELIYKQPQKFYQISRELEEMEKRYFHYFWIKGNI